MIALNRNNRANRIFSNLYRGDKNFRLLTNFIKELNKQYAWENVEEILTTEKEISNFHMTKILQVVNKVYFGGSQKSKRALVEKYVEARNYIKYVDVNYSL